MAKQSKDVFNIPMSPITLATEAAVQEAAQAAAAKSADSVPVGSADKNAGDSPSVSINTPRKQSRREAVSEPVIKAETKEQRINRTFTITATNDKRLGLAAVHYGVTKSAILEQLFERFWDANSKDITNM